MEEITAQNFDEVISSNSAVVVDFSATWCQPCKMLGKLLEELAPEFDQVRIVKVDIDKSQELAQKFEVMSVPTMVFFKDGKQVDKMIGFKGKPAVEAALQALQS